MEIFVYNTNLSFLYKIDIEFQQKIKLPPVGIELQTPIRGAETVFRPLDVYIV